MVSDVRMRLVEVGGRTSQDLGAGRIVGQVLVYLYLQENECSLDVIGEELGLSKASISIAVRQLEQLGFVRKVWKKGDRKNYYRSADNIGTAVQQGLLTFVRQKVRIFGSELETGMTILDGSDEALDNSREVAFLRQRIGRARRLQLRLERVLENPIVRMLTKENNETEQKSNT